VLDQVAHRAHTDVTVVTSDRDLQDRVRHGGAGVLGAGTLLTHLEASR
jgi:predicted RNA-binding protein with PIN domain